MKRKKLEGTSVQRSLLDIIRSAKVKANFYLDNEGTKDDYDFTLKVIEKLEKVEQETFKLIKEGKRDL